jgi:hypothetical protein
MIKIQHILVIQNITHCEYDIKIHSYSLISIFTNIKKMLNL